MGHIQKFIKENWHFQKSFSQKMILTNVLDHNVFTR